MVDSNVSKFLLNDIIRSNIIDELERSFKDNEEIIIDALEIDNKYSSKSVSVDKFIDIVKTYKNFNCNYLEENDRKIVVYSGDPYLTINLCMQACIKKCRLLLLVEEYMFAVNKVILKIVEDVISKYSMFNMFNIDTNIKIRQLYDVKKIYKDLVIIGDSVTYELVKNEVKVEYFPYNNVALYSDAEELEDLKLALVNYANENNYDIEVMYDDIDDTIFEINNDETKDIVVCLTNKLETKEKFEKEIINKKIYVNDNPFKGVVGNIQDYLR